MKGKFLRAEWLLFAALSTALFLPGCHTATEQDQIKKIIISVQKAAENKDIKKVLSHVSETYRDPQGNDYAGIKNILLFYFFRHPKISLFITDIEADVSDLSARSTFEAVLSGGNVVESPRDLFPEAVGAYRFAARFRKEAGEWKVISAKWDRVQDALPQ